MNLDTAAPEAQKERVQWLDVLKLIGIFEVFTGHFGGAVGRFYPFVFTHHVALFFFAAGCAEAMASERGFISYTTKKAKELLVPFFLFGVLSIITVALVNGTGFQEAFRPFLGLCAGAIRNRHYMGLWFLTCLFVTSILFWLIRRIPSKPLILLVCFACQLIPIPNAPCLPYNVDSALQYLVFYALGYFLFPLIQRVLAARTVKSRLLLGCSGLVSLGFSLLVYFQRVPAFPWDSVPVLSNAMGILYTLLLVWLWVLVAFLLRNVRFLALLGRDTAYACGNEYIVNLAVPALLGLAGLKLSFSSPLPIFLYCALLLVLIHYTLAPLERAMVRWIVHVLEGAGKAFRAGRSPAA